MTATQAPGSLERPATAGDGDPRRWYILVVLCLGLLVVGIDGTIVNVALPTLVREIGASIEPTPVDRRRVHDRVRQLPAHRREHR